MDELFHLHWEEVFDAAFKRIGDEEVAQDITQEIFISLWENRATLQIEGTISAYLYGAVKYRVINYFRMQAKREGHHAELSYLMEKQSIVAADSRLITGELDKEINDALNLLPERMRQVISMSRRQDRSIKEISDELGISVQTVKNQITAAMKILKKNLSYLLFLALFLS